MMFHHAKKLTLALSISLIFNNFAEKQKPDLAIKQPTQTEQYDLAKAFLRTHLPQNQSAIYSSDAIEKLGLIENDTKTPALSHQFAGATVFGRIAIESLLSHPASDLNIIKQHQNAVKTLVKFPNVNKRIEKSLVKIAQGQSLFLSFIDKKYELDKELLERLYFKRFTSLNKNSYALGASRTAQGLSNAILYFIPIKFWLIAGHELQFFPFHASLLKKIKTLCFEIPYEATKQTVTTEAMNHWPVTTSQKFQNNYAPSLQDQKDQVENAYLQLGFQDTNATRLAYGITYGPTIFGDLFYAWRIKNGMQEVKLDDATLQNIQTKLIGAALVIEGLNDLYVLLQEYPLITNVLPELTVIKELFENSSADVQNLLNSIQKVTFKGEASFFSNSARILATNTLLLENINSLSKALAATGKLDAFVAATKLMQKNAEHNAHYCFVDFIEDTDAQATFTGFWNPLLTEDQAVKNSVQLSNNDTQNILISGPNGTGKSVIMKGIMLNIILAQTFGIAAADSVTMTLFDKLNVYLNVQENLEAQLSTFMAERKKLQELTRIINNLGGQKAFTIIDEPLKGTLNEEGGNQLFEFGKNIAMTPNSFCWLATHHEKPTELESVTAGHFTNCYLEIDEVTTGQFIRTFMLTKGLNPWWFVDAEKRARFFVWLNKLDTMK